MDTLYIGDIPEDYHYAVLSNDYITLYNTDTFSTNSTYNYYRIYTNYSNFMYSQGTTTVSSYNTISVQDIDVSSDWWYRNDIFDICGVCFIIIFMFIFVFNIATSCFKKGGVFSELL